MIQIAKNEDLGHFGPSDRLQIAYFDNTKWFWQFGCHMAHAGSFKIHKNAFLNDPKSQKRGFLDLGLMDRLDIAYGARTKCFPPFGNTTMSWKIIQKARKMIRRAKNKVFGHYLEFGL